MAGGTVLVHKEEQQKDISVPSQSASPPNWAMDAVASVKQALDSIRSGAAKIDNPLPGVQSWVTHKQEAFTLWLGQQPIAVECAVSAALAALQGAAAGGLVATLNKDMAKSFEATAVQRASMGVDPSTMKNPFLSPEGMASSPVIQARNFAVLTGTNAAISSVLKRVRGVDDMENSLAAAFGSGFVFQLVSSTGTPNIAGAVGTGAFFALLQGGIYKLGQMMSKEKKTDNGVPTSKDDLYYAKARNMLLRLGLERYEKNFRAGMLTDVTLPLLTESTLQEVKIPPGPRLVILDHIQRDCELVKGRGTT